MALTKYYLPKNGLMVLSERYNIKIKTRLDEKSRVI